jgi:hypothetical protein
MFDAGSIHTACAHCEQMNETPMCDFFDARYQFKASTLARCKKCNRDYLVSLEERLNTLKQKASPRSEERPVSLRKQ